MDLFTYLFHEGEYYNEQLEPVDFLEIKLANEKAEIILRHATELEKVRLVVMEMESVMDMRLLMARQELGFWQTLHTYSCRKQGIEPNRIGTLSARK